jgi:hypothetical protein
MATTLPLSPAANEEANESDAYAGGMASEQALVHSMRSPLDAVESGISGRVARLPVELDVSVPVRNFRVRDLLALEPSCLIESGWGHGDDVPLASGPVQLAWSEFEVIDTQLAVRVTRLA